MYEPIHFRMEGAAAAFRLVRENPLGLLISRGGEGVIADPLPFLLEEELGEIFPRARVAAPNPQWRVLAEHPEALVVFQGLDHYVTPEWYVTRPRQRQGGSHLELSAAPDAGAGRCSP